MKNIMKQKYELVLLISDTREKMQFAEDQDDVELSTNLLFALQQQYESLWRLIYEELEEALRVRKVS